MAYALAEIMQEANGDPIDEESLDYSMGLVVNNHDDVLTLIREYGADEHRELIRDELHADDCQRAETAGRERGKASGSWVIDGNTSEDTARAILEGIEDGDPQVLDMQPAPLSGEWAGESISELSAEYGLNLEDEDIADAFEAGFSEGFWHEVESHARATLDLD